MNSLVKVPPYSKLNFQGTNFFTQNCCSISLMYIDKFKLLHGDNQETKTKTQYAGAKIRRGLSLLYRNLLVCSNFVCIIYVSQSHFPFLLIQNVKNKNRKQDVDFRIYILLILKNYTHRVQDCFLFLFFKLQ